VIQDTARRELVDYINSMICASYGSEIDIIHNCSDQTFNTTFHHRIYDKEAKQNENSSLVILKSSGLHTANTAFLSTVVDQYATTVGISLDVKTSQRIFTDNNLPRDE
jgi:hypothetical protein